MLRHTLPVLTLLICCGTLLAQVPDVGNPNVGPGNFDGKNYGRINWVKPGVRFTYYATAASVPGSSHQLVPDPEGNWYSPSTGQKFSEKAVPGPAGHGFTEVTVVYIDDRIAVLDIRSLGMNPSNNNSRSLLTYSAFTGSPDNGEFFIHPARLAALQNSKAKGMGVYRMPFELNGRTFNAVRINTIAGGGASSYVYDADSGVLLFTSSSASGSPVVVGVGDKAGVGAGSTVLAQSRLLAIRETNLPWNGQPLPQWAAQVRTIDIQGRIITEIPGAGSVALPMAGRIEFRGGNGHYREFAITTQITVAGAPPQMPNTLQRVTGNAGVGSVFIAPAALANLRQGTVLDDDQQTGMRTTVRSMNGQTVVLAEDGQGYNAEYHYDVRSGMLIRVLSTTTLPTGRETIEYNLVNPR